MKAELFETELTASTLIIFCPLAGFKVIQPVLIYTRFNIIRR